MLKGPWEHWFTRCNVNLVAIAINVTLHEGILVEVGYKKLEKVYKIINLYGLGGDMKPFREGLVEY